MRRGEFTIYFIVDGRCTDCLLRGELEILKIDGAGQAGNVWSIEWHNGRCT